MDACVERFPHGSTESAEAFADVARVVEGLCYDGFISSPKNGYQVNLTFDERLVAQLRASSRECVSEPVRRANLLAPWVGMRMPSFVWPTGR